MPVWTHVFISVLSQSLTNDSFGTSKHQIVRTTNIEEVMADKRCQQNLGSWKTTGVIATDVVDDSKVELHAWKRQSQEPSQFEVLEQEQFCYWRHWLSLRVWGWEQNWLEVCMKDSSSSRLPHPVLQVETPLPNFISSLELWKGCASSDLGNPCM